MPQIETINTPENFGNLDEELLVAIKAHRSGWHRNSPFAGIAYGSELISFDTDNTVLAGNTLYDAFHATNNLICVQLEVQFGADISNPNNIPATVNLGRIAKFLCDVYTSATELTNNGGHYVADGDMIYLTQPHEWRNFKIQALVTGTHYLRATYYTIDAIDPI
jgi:hypothetical protein